MIWKTREERDRAGRVRLVTHEAEAGILRVVVHRLHGLDSWFLSVHPGITRAWELHTSVEADAMRLAEEHVRALLTESLAACDEKNDGQ